MKLGLLVAPGRRIAALAVAAEAAGFESLWFIDSPAVYGDPFVAMATAASVTTRIRLATGVINPVSRSAVLAAASLASVEALAPGRVMAGVGVGFTGVFALGLERATVAELESYVWSLRTLLDGGEARAPWGALQRLAGAEQPESLAVGSGVPLVLAAANRRSLGVAARCADGILLGGVADEQIVERVREELQGATSAMDDGLSITPAALLTTDGPPTSEEVRRLLGPKCLGPAKNFRRWVAEVHGPASRLAAQTEAVARAYAPAQASVATGGRDHLDRFRRYVSELEPWQEDLVTDEIVAMTAIVGTPDDWVAKLERLSAAGIGRVILSPVPALAQATLDACGASVVPRLV